MAPGSAQTALNRSPFPRVILSLHLSRKSTRAVESRLEPIKVRYEDIDATLVAGQGYGSEDNLKSLLR